MIKDERLPIKNRLYLSQLFFSRYDKNPTVDGVSDIKLQMTQNLNQNPRVFQDRSEVFKVEDPPRNLKRKDIYYYVGIGKEGDQVTAYTALNKRLLWPRKEIMKPGEGKAVCFVGHGELTRVILYLYFNLLKKFP